MLLVVALHLDVDVVALGPPLRGARSRFVRGQVVLLAIPGQRKQAVSLQEGDQNDKVLRWKLETEAWILETRKRETR